MTRKILASMLFEEKNYVEGFYKDENFDKVLKFRTKNIDSYFSSLNKYKKDIRRLLPRLFALPFIWVISAKNK